MPEQERALCAATASLLRASGAVAHWGFALACIALAALAVAGGSLSMASRVAFGAVAALGVVERYLSLRLQLDAGLFDGLAQGTIVSVSSLDHALGSLGLRPAPEAPRPLTERVHGTRVLLRRHGIAVACQSALFVFALLAHGLQ